MASYPKGLPKRYRLYWAEPWHPKARKSAGFRSWLDRHGYLTPHFTLKEAACKDGTPIPRRLRGRARTHAFNVERLRNRVGPLPVLSWYRTDSYNRMIGGAIASRHVQADATDFAANVITRIGREKFFREAGEVFNEGGVGAYPAGSAHVDSRGYKARWSSFVGW